MPLSDNMTTVCLYLIGLALPMESLLRAVEPKQTKQSVSWCDPCMLLHCCLSQHGDGHNCCGGYCKFFSLSLTFLASRGLLRFNSVTVTPMQKSLSHYLIIETPLVGLAHLVTDWSFSSSCMSEIVSSSQYNYVYCLQLCETRSMPSWFVVRSRRSHTLNLLNSFVFGQMANSISNS